MEPIQPIGPRVYEIPGVERVSHRVDPDQQKREQQKREQQRKHEQRQDPDEPEEDDGMPHIDVCC
ncbi:MAG TPA: hypothetical protein VJU60_02600 [Thermoleophilaceae bacterium]|nr:hypothetical protein [Thermoleophilaceae bacterium]